MSFSTREKVLLAVIILLVIFVLHNEYKKKEEEKKENLSLPTSLSEVSDFLNKRIGY